MKRWQVFSREEIEEFAKESTSFAELGRKCGYSHSGSATQQMKHVVSMYNIDISHFLGQGWALGKEFTSSEYIPFYEYIERDNISTNKLRKKIIKEGIKPHMCEICLNTTWNGSLIPLEVHHKDGNKKNNKLENLQLLCPNCHALTDNYRGRNIKKHKNKEKNIVIARKKNFCIDCGKEINRNSTRCTECCKKHLRHVERPEKEQLKNELTICKGNFTFLSKKYGVSGNAIRKWCVNYGLSNKSKDYK